MGVTAGEKNARGATVCPARTVPWSGRTDATCGDHSRQAAMSVSSAWTISGRASGTSREAVIGVAGGIGSGTAVG